MSHLSPFWIRSQRHRVKARLCPISLQSDSPNLFRLDPPTDQSRTRRSAQRESPFPGLCTQAIQPWRRPSQQRSRPSESSPRPEIEVPERGNETAWGPDYKTFMGLTKDKNKIEFLKCLRTFLPAVHFYSIMHYVMTSLPAQDCCAVIKKKKRLCSELIHQQFYEYIFFISRGGEEKLPQDI